MSSFKCTLDSSIFLTCLKAPACKQPIFTPFIGLKGPHDDNMQNAHMLNSRASLGTSGNNNMADKRRGLHRFDFAVLTSFISGDMHDQADIKGKKDGWKYHFK